MEKREWVELALVPMVAGAAFAGRAALPAALPLGEVVLAGASLLLGQGLIRDLYLTYGAQAGQSCQLDPQTGRALAVCMESTLGMVAIALGAALLLSGAERPVTCTAAFWPTLVLAIGWGGFLLKDVVIDLRARRLRLEKDHRNVLFG